MGDDFRAALRQLWRKPAIALVAAMSLALGTGATAAIFGCLDALYMRPTPVPNDRELVRVFGATEQQSYDEISYPEYREIRAQCRSLSSLGVAMHRGATWLDQGESHDLLIYLVSPDFFQALQVKPWLGRLFGPEEEKSPAIVLGYNFWKRRFGGDPAIVGRTILVSRGRPVNVIVTGILPPDFREIDPTGDRDVWMPPATFAAVTPTGWEEFEDWGNVYFDAVGRLNPGTNLHQLHAELGAVSSRLAKHHAQTNARRHLHALSDLGWRLHQAGTTAVALALVVLFVVAISCVNVANLLLAGIEGRRKEIATKVALGAPRWRLARQVFLECTLIGVGGMAAGFVLGDWLIAAVPALIGLPPEYRSDILLRLDPRVFCSTAAVSGVTALLVGLVLAAPGSKADLSASLRNVVSGGRHGIPMRTWLALSQLALALVLLTGTSVLGQAFWNARHGEIGLARKNILAVWASPAPRKVERETMERLRGLPAVRDVSLAFRAPLSHNGGGIAMPVVLTGHPEFRSGNPATIKFNSVEPRFFQLYGIRLLRGRVFTDADTENAPRVIVISNAMARRYWPREDPLGKWICRMPGGEAFQVVGVVADAPINEIGEVPEPYLYTVWWQNSFGELTLLMETSGDAAAMGPSAMRALAGIHPDFKRAELFTVDQLIRDATIIQRAAAQLVAVLALLGLLLAAVGFYGVISYGVTLRRREIGIRMALGARERDAAGLVVREALMTAGLGIALGITCSLAATWAIRAVLFGVSPWYPPAFGAASVILLLVAMAAAWLPARRAARVDPLVALRYE